MEMRMRRMQRVTRVSETDNADTEGQILFSMSLTVEDLKAGWKLLSVKSDESDFNTVQRVFVLDVVPGTSEILEEIRRFGLKVRHSRQSGKSVLTFDATGFLSLPNGPDSQDIVQTASRRFVMAVGVWDDNHYEILAFATGPATKVPASVLHWDLTLCENDCVSALLVHTPLPAIADTLAMPLTPSYGESVC